jgi:hypothetical protein
MSEVIMDKRLKLLDKLKKKDPSTFNVLVGFDGFVDEIIHVVDKRQDPKTFSRVKTISDFAKKIDRASGLSSNIEFVPINSKIGGNGPIMSNALIQHHLNITYIGTLGYPNIHEVFYPLADKANIYSIAKYGETQAVEFNDGKLLIGKMNSLVNVDYDHLTQLVSEDKLVNLISSADLFATVNWSMLPYMTDIWEKIIENVLPQLSKKKDKPIFFVDLADPEKREKEDIIYALNLLKKFKSHFKVVLGLNKKEAYDIAELMNIFTTEMIQNVPLEKVNRALYEKTDVDYLVIHPVDRSSVVFKDTYYEELGPYISEPKLTTGAGDNFNAGFVLGLLLGLNPDEALLTGMSTSGYYVRNASSPNYQQLLNFIEDWTKDRI